MNLKNINKAFLLLIVCIFSITGVNAQNKKLDKANQAYDKFAFIEAIKLYEQQLEKGNNAGDIYAKLGDCYYFNGRYDEAIKCYAKIMSTKNGLSLENYFRYAQALSSIDKHDEAQAVMKEYFARTNKKDISENWGKTKLAADIAKQSNRYDFKPVDINSPESDFGTAFNGKDMVIYASGKDTSSIFKSKHSWNEKSFLKLYSADVTVDGGLQNPVLLKGDINTRYHQSTPAITKDGKTMYFTRNNYVDGKLAADKKGTTYLKIYVADNVKGEWKNIRPLGYPINSDGFSSAHPALSADESELYFVSDRNNNFGNSDIYVASLKKGGFVGNDVKKLGDEINTLGRETYPFVDDKGILYFSSDGHPGLGGLDVFAAIKDTDGIYHVVNMGDEVNSSADDFAYIINDETKKGYFSSNRAGNDDIYSFTENRKVVFDINIQPIVYGTLKYTSGPPIEDVSVEIYDTDNTLIKTVKSDKEGYYTADLEPYKLYKILYKKPSIVEKSQEVPQLKPLEKREYSFNFTNEMEVQVGDKTVTLEPGDDLTRVLKLSPIFFDYGGYNIRKTSMIELDKVVEVLKARPSLTLTVNSHTDSRGRDDFNMKLSENRAKATVDYIIAHGIDASRVQGHGYGETQLLNRCANGVKCSEAEHQENRRSEFIINVVGK
ncbi:OmpA family protein [Flavobacterium gelatinilyticum]|uniref:OmpA family protein n=1 Tax=Flavobacterium gelatinilyticum TaxID=3003260 RepID=UPI002481393A|nr:OmpA family protein [Flavobacterium gelatinilyticum]